MLPDQGEVICTLDEAETAYEMHYVRLLGVVGSKDMYHSHVVTQGFDCLAAPFVTPYS